MTRVAADTSPDPLWLSYTCDFKKAPQTLPHAEKHCCDQPKRPTRLCLLVPDAVPRHRKRWLSVKPTEYETHKELSQGASQHAGSGYETSALL